MSAATPALERWTLAARERRGACRHGDQHREIGDCRSSDDPRRALQREADATPEQDDECRSPECVVDDRERIARGLDAAASGEVRRAARMARQHAERDGIDRQTDEAVDQHDGCESDQCVCGDQGQRIAVLTEQAPQQVGRYDDGEDVTQDRGRGRSRSRILRWRRGRHIRAVVARLFDRDGHFVSGDIPVEVTGPFEGGFGHAAPACLVFEQTADAFCESGDVAGLDEIARFLVSDRIA